LEKTWFKLDAFYLPILLNLKFGDIKEVRILSRNKCFYPEFVYQQPEKIVQLDKSRLLSIDHGINKLVNL